LFWEKVGKASKEITTNNTMRFIFLQIYQL